MAFHTNWVHLEAIGEFPLPLGCRFSVNNTVYPSVISVIIRYFHEIRTYAVVVEDEKEGLRDFTKSVVYCSDEIS